MSHIISSKELLVLRDGKPFGQIGTFGGTALDWPMPQTIAGMCRTALGFGRGEDYFAKPENCSEVLKIALKNIIPVLDCRGKQEPLLPVPADLVFAGDEGESVHPLQYQPLADGEGTDLPAGEWLYPTVTLKGKQSSPPRFLRTALADQYIKGSLPAGGSAVDHDSQTISGPAREFRIHSAINPDSHSVSEGKLFAESGIYLTASKRASQKAGSGLKSSHIIGDIQISFELEGISSGEKIPPALYLGGDRKRVEVSTVPAAVYPPMPGVFEGQKYLKLALTTHGDFGGWAPEWLLPKGDLASLPWVKEPRSGIEIRLRSAVVSGWDPISGWDYEKKKPKALRKLVKPGSIYLIELKNESQSLQLAQSLWGASICQPGSQSERDGFGQVIIAKK